MAARREKPESPTLQGMSHSWPGVSALGVLDGEADALAALCDRRGPSVVGYCELVCGRERAIEAASAAFAAFRAGAVRATEPLSIDPESLLLGRTRAAAAQRAPKPVENLIFADVPCSQIAALLAEDATGSLSPADRDRLRRHLARCVACRATQAIQQEAERAYFHPGERALDAIARQEIVEALSRAVPAATPNGHRPRSTPAALDAIRQASAAPQAQRVVPQLPRKVPLAGSSSTSTPVGPSPGTPPPTSTTPGRPASPPGQAAPLVGGPQPAGGRTTPHAADAADQDTPPNGMPAASLDLPTGVMSAVEINAALGYEEAPGNPAAYADWQGSPVAVPVDAATPPTGAGGRRRMGAPLMGPGRDAGRVSGARIVGPAAVLVVGLLIALFVAGVFNGGAHRANTNPLSGAQTSPSVTLPSTVGGVTGSGAGVAGGGATAGAGATGAGSAAATAVARRAARRRAAALARRRRTAAGSSSTKTTSGAGAAGSTTTGAVTHATTKPPAAAPSTPSTPKKATTGARIDGA